MARHNIFLKTSVIAVVVTALAIYSAILVATTVSAQFESGQKKDTKCMDDTLHTRDFCDGYFVGNGDCEYKNKYRGNSNAHTSDWRSGYFEGYLDGGCMPP
jgi:hypothetical protein